MNRQKQLIHATDWDTLIVLDACRYDYFKERFGSYLSGELKRVKSEWKGTLGWLVKTFDEEYYDDLVYVSGNPFTSYVEDVQNRGFTFNADRKFHDVVDVWDFGFDYELNTVPPQKMSEELLKARKKYPEKRLIGHYMQPHIPYLAVPEYGNEDLILGVRSERSEVFLRKLRKRIGELIEATFGKEMLWEIRKALGIKPSGVFEIVYREGSLEKLEEFYVKNLEFALEAVSGVLSELSGRMVVTADHGEMLGEDGHYGHKRDAPEWIKIVPWLEVEA